MLAWYSMDSQGDFGGVAGGRDRLPSATGATTRAFVLLESVSFVFVAPAALAEPVAEGQFFGELDAVWPRRLFNSIARCRLVTRESLFSGDDLEEAELTDMLSELELVARCATLFLILWRADVGVCEGSEAVDMFPADETDAPPTDPVSIWLFAQLRWRRDRCSLSARVCLPGDFDGDGIFAVSRSIPELTRKG